MLTYLIRYYNIFTMEKLKRYLELIKVRNYSEWAKENEISNAVICRAMQGKTISSKNISKIIKATDGYVTFNDLVHP